ncbi:MAG TPA: thioredoxin TrxC [Gammaproteobacteria bacterium]|nr:thioredoxin TrxC [Gammaproteobacteria bacterium]
MSESIVVPCAHCAMLNRIPNEKRAAEPQCGSCKKPIFIETAFDLDPATFAKQSKGDVPLLVDVWASWCGPCRQFAPIFGQAAAQLSTQCRFGKLDSEAHPALSGELGVRSIPSLILFRNGKEVDRQSGALPLVRLLGWLKHNGIDN